MKSDEPEIKPAYKNPIMEHYECDGQISLFDYEEQTQKTDRPENVDESGCPGQISMFDYWDEELKYNETKDDCDGKIKGRLIKDWSIADEDSNSICISASWKHKKDN